jgi:hypothetical protein
MDDRMVKTTYSYKIVVGNLSEKRQFSVDGCLLAGHGSRAV